ncbi:hypothetical protein M758_5G083800, partial [Ceratodon purpureus]
FLSMMSRASPLSLSPLASRLSARCTRTGYKLPSWQLILIILVESPVAILTIEKKTRSSGLHAPPATHYTRVDSGLPQQNMYRRFKDTAL